MPATCRRKTRLQKPGHEKVRESGCSWLLPACCLACGLMSSSAPWDPLALKGQVLVAPASHE